MKTSENIAALAEALAKAQGEIKNAKLNHKAKLKGMTAGGKSYEYEYKYADLADTFDAIREVLPKNNIATFQCTSRGEDGNFYVYTRLAHSSGQWIESAYPIAVNLEKPQVTGAAYTYARRYSLAAITGIATEEDNDGKEVGDTGTNGKFNPSSLQPKVHDMPRDSAPPERYTREQRKDYNKLEDEMSTYTDLDAAQDWYDGCMEVRKRQTPEWQHHFLMGFLKHCFSVAESKGAVSTFRREWDAAIKAMPEDIQIDLDDRYTAAIERLDKRQSPVLQQLKDSHALLDKQEGKPF